MDLLIVDYLPSSSLVINLSLIFHLLLAIDLYKTSENSKKNVLEDFPEIGSNECLVFLLDLLIIKIAVRFYD